jgi:hypothetical protein
MTRLNSGFQSDEYCCKAINTSQSQNMFICILLNLQNTNNVSNKSYRHELQVWPINIFFIFNSFCWMSFFTKSTQFDLKTRWSRLTFERRVLPPSSGRWVMDEIRTSETSVYFNESRRLCIAEGCHLHTRENKLSYTWEPLYERFTLHRYKSLNKFWCTFRTPHLIKEIQ